MEITDLTIEVRDRDLNRVGIILPTDATFLLRDEFCNVGQWTVTLPLEHPMVDHLRAPGGGLIATGPDGVTLLSGPAVKASSVGSKDDPEGMVTITGVTDDVVLADALAYANPADPTMTGQAVKANDVRTGPLESVLHAFVNANIGPGAPAARRKAKLVMGTNLGRGPTVTKSARFPTLGTLLNEIAALGDIGFRVIQRGAQLVFETYQVADRSKTIRMDLWNNTLASYDVQTAGATLTRAIVAGQEEGVDRQLVERTTAEAEAQEALWGRRIERFLDRRNTDDLLELAQAGDEALAKEGIAQALVKFVPMDETTMRYVIDWGLGDRVTAVVEGQEMSAVVQAAIIKVDAQGIRLAVALGDAAGTVDEITAFRSGIEQRVSAIERTVEVASGTPKALGNESLNTVLAPGTYFQADNTLATLARNYPLQSHGGTLEVVPWAGASLSAVQQRFTPHRGSSAATPNGNGNRVWVRGWTSASNTWSPWVLEGIVSAHSQSELDLFRTSRGPITGDSPWQIVRTDQHNGYRFTQDGQMWSRLVPDAAPFIYPALATGWGHYDAEYHHIGYATTHAGITVLTGLASKGAGSGTLLLTLPVGARPERALIFPIAAGGSNWGEVRIYNNGEVHCVAPNTNTWYSLDGIMFPNTSAVLSTPWTTITTLQSGWGHYSDPTWGGAQWCADMYGRIWHRGLISWASGASGIAFYGSIWPAAGTIHLPMNAGSQFASMFVHNTGYLGFNVAAPSPTWLSLAKVAYAGTSSSGTYNRLRVFSKEGMTRYSAGFPDQGVRVFPDGIAMMEGLVAGGSYPSGANTSGFIPPGIAPDIQPNAGGSHAGRMVYLVSAQDGIGRNDLEFTRENHTGLNSIGHQEGNPAWRSLGGINYLIGS